MPSDLFTTSARVTHARSRQSSLVLASATLHLVAVVAIVVGSILVPGLMPKPHAAGSEWQPPTYVVRLTDVALPARRTATVRPSSATAPVLLQSEPTPLVAPDRITPARDSAPLEQRPSGLDQIGVPAGDVSRIDGGPLPQPPPPPAQPNGPMRLHSGINPPRKVHDVTPVYPTLARTAGARGVVIIEATIDARGEVSEAKILRSIPLLDSAALDAVRQWRFTPARLNGEPVAVLITVTVNFTLADR